MEIYKKLLNIQCELKAPKSQYNSFGKYKYRSCEDILEALKPLLFKYKATLILSDEIVLIGDRYYLKATAKIIDIEDGATIENYALAREDETKKGQDLAQVTGSVSSYARKYALNGLFAIDDTKDSDATNKHDKDKPAQLDTTDRWTNKLSDKQISRLYAIAYSKGIDKDTVKKHVFKKFTKDVVNMTKEEYDLVCSGYENLQNKSNYENMQITS